MLKNQKDIKSIIFFLIILINYSLFSQSSIDKITNYVKYLSDDKLEGRYPGTKGNEDAADYISNHYKNLGIKPLGGDYKQYFPVATGLKLGQNNSLSFDVLIERPGVEKELWKKQTRNWNINQDFIPMRFSENGTVEAELVFVGFGVTAKDLNYDDYKDVDVFGKIVIVLIDSAEGKPMFKKLENYSDLKYKTMNAREHGAKGIIFVKMNSDSANVLMPLKLERHFKNTGIIAVQASRTSLAAIFPRNQNLYPLEQEIIKTFKPKSFVLPNVTAKLVVNLEEDIKNTPNIIAKIDGTNPQKANEYFVIGAHYDHLGWGADNSLYKGKTPMIHNGADDNASGTSGIMELAERLKSNPLNRPVIIANFSAEEMGLLGSSYYIKNTIIPKENIKFMLNLDMIGRLKDNKLNVFGIGSSEYFANLVDSLGGINGLSIIKSSDGFAPSDHSTFYAQQIPVLFLFTGVHNDYHTPNDDWDKINFEGLSKVVDYSEKILRSIDAKAIAPEFKQADNSIGNAPMGSSGRHSSGVWFGIMPNFEESTKGLKISGTSAGSPAQEAGLKADDIILKLNEANIKNLYDLTTVLKEYKPGDKVKVKYLRNEKEMEVEVTLKKR